MQPNTVRPGHLDLLKGVTWAADSGCFNAKTYVGDEQYMAWLDTMQPASQRCLFATAPDVVGDAEATLQRSLPFLQRIRDKGYPVAYVGQDGATPDSLPWDQFDWLFLGGTNEFKLGPEAVALTERAHQLGVPVHMGRVNSGRRWRYARDLGCKTVDGTFLAFGPVANLKRLLSWLEEDERHAKASQQVLPFGA